MIGPQERWLRHVRRKYARDGHNPTRSYACHACASPWPCRPARLALLTAHQGDRIGLMVYLGTHLARALRQLPDTHPALITAQLLGWLPRRH
ncbi:flavin reductase [Plantactinospora sp. B6F1]|uniref:flavin reductase n=1 Tax=Plantactinospora sp. B6F1 TaxID=3158971 RepID=UPI0032D8BFCA